MSIELIQTELTDDDIAQGNYRFEDLVDLKIVKNRTDLNRKQKELNFPKPIKSGKSQASFIRVEVHRWVRWRIALRDAKPELPPPQTTKLIEKPRAKLTGTALVKKSRTKPKPDHQHRGGRRTEHASA